MSRGILLVLVFFAVALTAVRLAESRYRRVSALFAVLAFLLNPLFLAMPRIAFWSTGIDTALLAMVFVTSGLWMNHWSSFMRALVLSIIFSCGWWTGCWSAIWIAISLVVWLVFNRRRAWASAMALAILVPAFLLYTPVRSLGRLVLTMRNQPWPAWSIQPLSLEPVHRWLFIVLHSSVTVMAQQVLTNTGFITSSWTVLSLWLVAGVLRRTAAERRSDGLTVIATLAGLSWIAAMATTFSPYYSLAMLATFLAVTSPLLAAEFCRKEYFFNRPARWATGLGIFGGLLPHSVHYAALIQAAGTVVVGTAMSYLPMTEKLPWRQRWRGVLLGGFVGAVISGPLRLLYRQ